MTPREQLEKRLRDWGIIPDPQVLASYRIKTGPARYLYAGHHVFSENGELGRLQYTAMAEHVYSRAHPTSFDGKRFKSESGRLYPVSDPENAAEIRVTRAMAEFELSPFNFQDWPAREENGSVIVGTAPFELKWCGDTRSDVESFLRSVSIAEPFRARASNTDACCVKEVPIFGDLQQWFDVIKGVGTGLALPKFLLPESSSTAQTSTPTASKTEGESSTS
jgi:hypothetical protein